MQSIPRAAASSLHALPATQRCVSHPSYKANQEGDGLYAAVANGCYGFHGRAATCCMQKSVLIFVLFMLRRHAGRDHFCDPRRHNRCGRR